MGIPPTGTKPSGEPHYTLPAIIDYTLSLSQPVILSDSKPIIHYLERTYPSPDASLFPVGFEPLITRVEHILQMNVFAHFPSLWLMDLYNTKLPIDQEHFRKRMEAKFGTKLEDIELRGLERQMAWIEVQNAFDALAQLFAKTDDDFILGQHISYPDFALCACLIFMKTINSEGGWDKIGAWNHGKWVRFLHEFEGWMAVDTSTNSRL